MQNFDSVLTVTQGVGETLRGTLNSEIDNRIPRRNAEKQAAIRAQNEAVLARGRAEMAGIPHRERHTYQSSDGTTIHTSEPTTSATSGPFSQHPTAYTNPGTYGTATYNSNTDTYGRGTGADTGTGTYTGSDLGRPNTTLPSDTGLTGQGLPGSHSAVMGLTPSGDRYTESDTTHGGRLNHPSRGVISPDPLHGDRVSDQDLSSVSDLSRDQGDSSRLGYQASRGTVNRANSGAAPEAVGTANTSYGNTIYGASGTAGPHKSDMANRLDPRVDSDGDGRAGVEGSRRHDNTGTYDNDSHNTSGRTPGPHNSSVANKLDPRVDDKTGATSSRYASGSTGYDQSIYDTGSGTTGPHNSNLANRLDPRVDSDTGATSSKYGTTSSNYDSTYSGYGSSSTGYGGNTSNYGSNTYGSNTTGNTAYNSSSTTPGPHSSSLANKLDPRVDNTTGATTADRNTSSNYNNNSSSNMYGSNTNTTTGPHSSDLANRADPRVDSNRDGRAGIETGNNNASTSTAANRTTTSGHISDGEGSKHESTLGKLFKRKPVHNTQDTPASTSTSSAADRKYY